MPAALLAAALSLPAGGCAAKQTDLKGMAPTYCDVVVAEVANEDGAPRTLKMNVFVPPHARGKVPLLIFVHGGGWAAGSYEGDDALQSAETGAASGIGAQMAGDNASTYKVFKDVLNHGIAFASVDYRLNSEAVLPAQLHDVKAVIRFLRAHADAYGPDANRFAIAGSSAGGHLAAEAALTGDRPELEGDVGGNLGVSSSVMACVDYYGPTDLLTMAPEMSPALQSPEEAAETHDSVRANESKLLGFTGTGEGVGVLRAIRASGDTSSPHWSMVEKAELFSPVHQVTEAAPPFFIAHGGHDTLVPIAQSLRLQTALTDAGVANLFVCNSTAPHGYQESDTNEAMIRWLCRRFGIAP